MNNGVRALDYALKQGLVEGYMYDFWQVEKVRNPILPKILISSMSSYRRPHSIRHC